MAITIAERPPMPAHDRVGSSEDWAAFSRDQLTWNESTGQPASSPRRRLKIPQQQLAEMTSQLAIMARSGVDTASSLGSLAAQCRRPDMAEVLRDVHASVLAGRTLSESLTDHPDIFETAFVAAVAAGEASGKMPYVLEQLAVRARKAIRARRTLRAMMTYPILLLAASSSVIAALVLLVLPKFADIFAQYDMQLPPLTAMLIAIAAELSGRWYVWLPLAAVLAVAGAAWRRTPQGRARIDSWWIRLPVIRDVYVSHQVARIFQSIALMLESGVPLLDTLRLTRHAVSNLHYKKLLDDLEESVVSGRNLANAIKHAEIVPQSAREMVATAEEAGKLGEVTGLLGAYYDEEAEAGMRQLVGLLEPAITIGMGLIVVVIVLAVMLPVFDLSTLANGSH